MKKIIQKIITGIANLLGLSIHIRVKANGKSDFVLVDRFVFSPYLNQEKEVDLYIKGMSRSDSKWSDNFYKQCRYYSLAQIAELASSSFPSFDIAECGVWKGHSAWMIANIFSQNSFTGTFHIFDSFEGGLSDKVKKDQNLVRNMSIEQIKREKEIFSSRESQVANCLSSFDFINIYAGWIPDRFFDVDTKNFSFVHIDVDLYQPTLDSLEFFWPRIIKGGYLIIDDYGSSQFPGASAAVDEFLKINPVSFFYKVPMGSCFIIK
jgi:O-methyltransferase